MIDSIPQVRLADLPTPLDDAPRLAAALGLKHLLIKRDDQTGLAMGGNKARKLEYDFADIVESGADVVVTVGGAQSNHARMTAAAACRLGLDVKLVLGGPPYDALHGNMLLDHLFGAEIRYLENDDENDHLEAAMDAWVRELAAAGRRPYALPIGGSTGLGAVGYVRAMRELAGQFGQGPAQIVLPVGSCGTIAGAIIGASMYMPKARVIGISVSRTSKQIASRTAAIMKECAAILKLPVFPLERDVVAYDQYYEEYGIVTDAGREAIITTARLEGILLDPVYTGKAMAGLIDLVAKGVLKAEIPTIFIHTGGLPILFAYEKHFAR
jgi:D-cysteine desulfhydrase family pyridoxal phosphate-dependent enzyme